MAHHGCTVALRQSLNHLQHIALVHCAQHLAHSGFLQLACPKGNGLVGEAERIAHRAPCKAPYQFERSRIMRDVLLGEHVCQVGFNGLGQHGPQVELQATAQHRHRHFLRVGGGQHKLQILGRLF